MAKDIDVNSPAFEKMMQRFIDKNKPTKEQKKALDEIMEDHKVAKDKLDHEVVNDFSIDAIKDNFTPPGAKSQKEDVKEEIDTNNNGEIEEDEMADFQKSLDDYAAKNKKGRDDIPVTTRR